MSYKVTAIVRASRLPPRIKRRPEAKGVLLALADRCDDDGHNSWPAVATIAAEVEVSRRTAHVVLASLAAHNLIAEQAPPCQHKPRTWRLNLEYLSRLADVQHVARLAPDMRPPDMQNSNPDMQNSNPDVQNSNPGVQNLNPGVQHVAPDPVLLNGSLNGPLNGQRKILSQEEIELRRTIAREAKRQLKHQQFDSFDALTDAVARSVDRDLVAMFSAQDGVSERDYLAEVVTLQWSQRQMVNRAGGDRGQF